MWLSELALDQQNYLTLIYTIAKTFNFEVENAIN